MNTRDQTKLATPDRRILSNRLFVNLALSLLLLVVGSIAGVAVADVEPARVPPEKVFIDTFGALDFCDKDRVLNPELSDEGVCVSYA